MDSDRLPEGLRARWQTGNRTEIVDAQEHVWVTIHDGANGDPVVWRTTITSLVIAALEAGDYEDEEGEEDT